MSERERVSVRDREGESPKDVVAYKLQQTTDGLSNDSRPQVPHVHLLGDVGGGKVDDHAKFLGDGRRSNAIQQDVRYQLRDEGWSQ